MLTQWKDSLSNVLASSRLSSRTCFFKLYREGCHKR